MASVADLERELVEAKRAEAEAAEVEAERARQAADRRKRVERQAGPLVQRLAERVDGLPAEMATLAEEAGQPPYFVRVLARRLLRGTLEPPRHRTGELVRDVTDLVTTRDPAAALAWSLNEACRMELGQVAAELQEHPLVDELDDLECRTWRLFDLRLHQLAGEAA